MKSTTANVGKIKPHPQLEKSKTTNRSTISFSILSQQNPYALELFNTQKQKNPPTLHIQYNVTHDEQLHPETVIDYRHAQQYPHTILVTVPDAGKEEGLGSWAEGRQAAEC